MGAVDIALWDIFGKDAGMPCHALMGGAARLDIPLYWSVGSGWRKTPVEMLDDVMDGWDARLQGLQDSNGLEVLSPGCESVK